MTRKQKLLNKLRSGGKNLRFTELCRAAEAVGFVRDRITGSHHTYLHPRVPDARLNLQPLHGGKAKPYQVRQLLELIERYNLKDDA